MAHSWPKRSVVVERVNIDREGIGLDTGRHVVAVNAFTHGALASATRAAERGHLLPLLPGETLDLAPTV